MGTRREDQTDTGVRGPEGSKGKVHGYYYEHNSIETECGRLAYQVSLQGQLVEPPLLMISRDWYMIDCWQCIKVLKIPPSYGLFRAVARHSAEQHRPKHLPHAGGNYDQS